MLRPITIFLGERGGGLMQNGEALKFWKSEKGGGTEKNYTNFTPVS